MIGYQRVANSAFTRNKSNSLPRERCSQRGVSMVETLISLPVLLLIIFSSWQAALVYEAKTTLNHAAFMAARAGALNNMDFDRMYQALDDVLSIIENNDTVRAARGRDDARDIADIFIANPTREVFVGGNAWAISDGGSLVLPNSNLSMRGNAERGGITIQDANILRIKVNYFYQMTVPIVADIYGVLVGSTRGDSVWPTFPLTAVATVHMQSSAVFPSDAGDQGRVLTSACVDDLANGLGSTNTSCASEVFPWINADTVDTDSSGLEYFGKTYRMD